MKLESFRIKNFKSIIDSGQCSFSRTDSILVLAGQNEAGKTAVLEALDFFRNGPRPHFHNLQKRREEHPEVICIFLLDEDDLQKISIEQENKKLDANLKNSPLISFVRGTTEEEDLVEIRLTGAIRKRLVQFFRTDKPDEPSPPTNTNGEDQQQTKESEEAPSSEEEEGEPDTVVENEPAEKENSLDAFEHFLIGQIPQFVIYDSFSDLLPGSAKISDMQTYPAAVDFQQVFRIDFQKIALLTERGIARAELKINQSASDDLNRYWTQQLDEKGQYNFRIRIVPSGSDESAIVQFMIDRGDGDPLFLEQMSKGFRWFSSFNMRLRALGIGVGTLSKVVLLIDEPGQGLHEKAQGDVKAVINELGELGAQTIYTTHHPNLIGTEGIEFSRIRVVSNYIEQGTRVETLSQYAARPGHGAMDALSPLRTAMGIQSIGPFISPGRRNVVVEGISDHYYLTALRDLLGRNPDYCFVPACGVNNVPNIASVLLGWGYDYRAVFDDDPNSGRTAYRLLKKEFYGGSDIVARKYIMKIPDCHGIEEIFDSVDFHKFVMGKGGRPTNGKSNSELAHGRKEVLARLFLERTKNEPVSLNSKTLKNVGQIFDWLDSTF